MAAAHCKIVATRTAETEKKPGAVVRSGLASSMAEKEQPKSPEDEQKGEEKTAQNEEDTDEILGILRHVVQRVETCESQMMRIDGISINCFSEPCESGI